MYSPEQRCHAAFQRERGNQPAGKKWQFKQLEPLNYTYFIGKTESLTDLSAHLLKM